MPLTIPIGIPMNLSNTTRITPFNVSGIINYPPVLNPIGNKKISENKTLVIDVDATDRNNNTLTYYTNAGQVLPSPFSFNQNTGLFAWTPTFNDSGRYFVSFNVTDGRLWDEEIIRIIVKNA